MKYNINFKLTAITFFVCFLATFELFAQGGNSLRQQPRSSGCAACNRPLSMYAFNNEYELFLRTAGFDRDREIRRYVRINCLHIEQLRHLAMLYPNDREKSEFFNFVVREGRISNPQFLYRLGTVFGSRTAQEAYYRFLSRENLPIGREVFDEYDDYYYSDRDYDDRRRGRDDRRGDDRHDDRRDDRRGDDRRDNRPYGMNDRDFSALLASIQQETFDSRRLDKIKVALTGNARMSCRQIATLAKLYSFDNTRLDFAKYAFDYAIDRENYYQVADMMQFDGNKRALLEYVRTRR
jgi:hypothetical protein